MNLKEHLVKQRQDPEYVKAERELRPLLDLLNRAAVSWPSAMARYAVGESLPEDADVFRAIADSIDESRIPNIPASACMRCGWPECVCSDMVMILDE